MRMNWRRTFATGGVLFWLVLGISNTAWTLTYSFTTIDVPDTFRTIATGINSAGIIVGMYYDESDADWHGFRLANGTYTTIDVPNGHTTFPSGINDSGAIVGTYTDNTGHNHGFLLVGDSFTTIDVPGAVQTSANGINNHGDIVGSYFGFGVDFGIPGVLSFNWGFLLSGGTFTTIPAESYNTHLYGINDRGAIVGSRNDDESFLLSDHTITTIIIPGSFLTISAGLNNHDVIAGSQWIDQGIHRGFLLSDGVYTTGIQVPGSFSTDLIGINDLGTLVGEYSDINHRGHGFVATPTSTTVPIDVRPGSTSNPVTPRSNGVISVAILSTSTFDASTVGPASVRFGPGAALARDVARLSDVNGDGELDLILQFRVQDTGIECGDAFASLTGETFSGEPIQGTDSLVTVGCQTP